MTAFLTPAQVAKQLQVSERLVVKFCVEGKVPGAFRFGRFWRVSEESFLERTVKEARAAVPPARGPTLAETGAALLGRRGRRVG